MAASHVTPASLGVEGMASGDVDNDGDTTW